MTVSTLLQHDTLGKALGSGTSAPVTALAPRSRPEYPHLESVVSDFRSGHAWTTGGADNTLKNLNDTSDFVIGSQAAKIVTLASPGNTATFGAGAFTALDLTGKAFLAVLKVDDITQLGSILLQLSSNGLTYTDINTLTVAPGNTNNGIILSGEWATICFGFTSASIGGTFNRAAVTAMRFRITPNANIAGSVATVHINRLATFTPLAVA